MKNLFFSIFKNPWLYSSVNFSSCSFRLMRVLFISFSCSKIRICEARKLAPREIYSYSAYYFSNFLFISFKSYKFLDYLSLLNEIYDYANEFWYWGRALMQAANCYLFWILIDVLFWQTIWGLQVNECAKIAEKWWTCYGDTSPLWGFLGDNYFFKRVALIIYEQIAIINSQ